MKTLILKDMCTPIFTAVLFKIAKICKQPKCPLTDGSNRHGVYTHTHTHTHTHPTHYGILLSHRKNKTLPFAATWMYLKNIMLSEVSQIEKDKYRMISLIHRI